VKDPQMTMQRREWLLGAGALGVTTLTGCAGDTGVALTSTAGGRVPAKARVLVVGGGYGGATAAKYVRLFSEQKIDVVLVEPNDAFVSCPMSNLVVGGSKTLADMTARYDTLASKHGVRVIKDMVASIDPAKKVAVLASGPTIAYDKLVLSPGVDLMFDNVQGLRDAQNAAMILQAWKAGPETVALRRQLEAMPDGGTFAITIPLAPYRCPPGPYERACQVASYFKDAKPKSKVLILDANPDVTSKPALFKKVWAEQYAGMVEYRAQHNATAVDARTNTVKC
jgi:sulfide dehydrogenase [flavocytochrome c] flavoprotein chain